MRFLLLAILSAAGPASAQTAYAPDEAQTRELDRRFDLYRRPGGVFLTLETKPVERDGVAYSALAYQSGRPLQGCDPQTDPHCFDIDTWQLISEQPGDRPDVIRQVRWTFYRHRANRTEEIRSGGRILQTIEYARERDIADSDVVEASAFAIALLLNPANGYEQSPFIFNH